MAGVLDDLQLMGMRKLGNCFHVCTLAVEVYGENGLDPARLSNPRPVQFGRKYKSSRAANIGERDVGTNIIDSVSGSKKRQCRDDGQIARAQIQRQGGKMQSRRTVCACHGKTRTDTLSKRLFKIRDNRASGQASAS